MEKKWWHDKIVYQIYPKSFMDSNDDGVGDIRGIIDKLDYLKDLGVDILWLTPFFASPMVDNGYDVSDYTAVNPLFGTMEDIDELIHELKKRNMELMIDVVANHTSDKHRWFLESRKSDDNPYSDYYIWRKEPTNNHQSCFGGSAWEYDEERKEYYFHEYAKGQPDLNWENPKIMDEIASAINFWMEKGVKGIRFDVIHLIGKEIDKNIYGYGPTLHQKVRELNERSFGKYDIVTVGEAWGNLDNAIDFTLPSRHELDMVFQFEVTDYTSDYSEGKYGKFTPRKMNMKFAKDTWSKYQLGLNDRSWNALFIENHDLVRAVNKFGDPEKYYLESAKEIATLYFFLKGTPFIYQGQELGMTNIKIDDINDYEDVQIKGNYKDLVLRDKVLTEEEFLKACNEEGRDNNRTPMQWDDTTNAGFNKGHKTWLKVNPNYHSINALSEMDDSSSILNYYKKMISLRKSEEYKDIFVYGEFKNIDVNNDNVFVYQRILDNRKIAVIVNMRGNEEKISLPFDIKKVLLHNLDDEVTNKLRPYEAYVIEVKD